MMKNIFNVLECSQHDSERKEKKRITYEATMIEVMTHVKSRVDNLWKQMVLPKVQYEGDDADVVIEISDDNANMQTDKIILR